MQYLIYQLSHHRRRAIVENGYGSRHNEETVFIALVTKYLYGPVTNMVGLNEIQEHRYRMRTFYKGTGTKEGTILDVDHR